MTGLSSRWDDTIVRQFCAQVARLGERTAMLVRRGAEFAPLTWRELGDEVFRAAAALRSLGISRGDRVILVSPNRYEWIVADLAVQLAGAVHVPVHASLSGAQIAHQIIDSGAVLVILSGQEQAEKLIAESGRFSSQLKVVAFDACPDAWEHFHFLRWKEILGHADPELARQMGGRAPADIRPDDLATILYTSGTTGEPKGVMLSQRNLASNALASVEAFGQHPDDLRLCWLPLSHIFARTCDFYTWIVAGARLVLADSPEAVIGNCCQLQPTIMSGVPYFFEKVKRYLVESGLAETPGVLAQLLGGHMRLCVTGGAPIPEHVARFYQAQDVLLLQGYGMTEAAPVITTETPETHKIGSVGRPIPGVEVKISADGEVLTRGPHVMLGYWQKPQDTSAMIEDGWLRTGDLGQLDADGLLYITGRKKDLIVTSGGKNIAPALLEALLTAEPLVRQAVVIGDRRNFLTALIVVDLEALAAVMPEPQLDVAATPAVLDDARVRRLFQECIERRLAVLSRYEQLGNFLLLAEPFSVEAGDLTPTLKLRRKAIEARHAARIEEMYAACHEM